MTCLAWHFLPDNGRMRWGKWKPVRAGVTYVHRGSIKLCEHGLHASVRAIDALGYAPGSLVCRVRMSGDAEADADKIAASRRRVLWMADATRVLHLYACRCAEHALALIPSPDPRSVRAIEIKRSWLDGKATIEELDAARDAAWDAASAAASAAARAAAWDAASAAARDAARDAAGVAASAAARDAAWDAAWAAARAAARAAAWDAARDAAWVAASAAARAAARDAAWDAAWAAARAAARDGQNAELTRLLHTLAPAGYVETP